MKIFTSEDPFHDVPPYTAITMISSGRRPQRPAEPPLTEDIWELMHQCWRQDPKSRPEMSTVLQELASCLLRSLYEFRKSLPEFQVALNQFYDSSKRGDCIDRLHNKDLQQFIDFLSDVRCSPSDHDCSCNCLYRCRVPRDWTQVYDSEPYIICERCAVSGPCFRGPVWWLAGSPRQARNLTLGVGAPKYGRTRRVLGEEEVGLRMCTSRC